MRKMKKSYLLLLLLLNGIMGCNDKPSIEPAPTQMLSVGPNPTTGQALAGVSNKSGQALTLQVFNPKGELVMEKTADQGNSTHFVNIHDGPAGKYQVILKSDKVLATQILLKL